MKIIKDVPSTAILAIDIETVRIVEHYNDLDEDYKSAWEYKNKQEGKVPDEEVLSDLWVKNASLWPEFSKVCSVAIAYLQGDTLKCKQYTSSFEYIILQELSKDLAAFNKKPGAYRLVGHASKHFDFPFLCKRYIINRMEIPTMLDESFCKPWEQTLLCTNELWKSFGSFSNAGSSLQSLCVALGVPISKVDLVGDEVGKAYFKGELERIGTYCSLDTIATFNVFRRFKLESIFLFSDVVYANKDVILKPGDFVAVKETVFEEVLRTQKLSKKTKDALNKAVKDLTTAEIENLVLILQSCMQYNNCSQEDYKFLIGLKNVTK